MEVAPMALSNDRGSALIIVDVQNDFADPTGSLYVRGAEEILPALDRSIALARSAGAVVAYSKDWHPPKTPHFQSEGGTWPVHCVAESWGAELVRGLPRASPAIVIHKGTGLEDGYSAFTVLPAQGGEPRETGLAEMLRRLGVWRVAVCGLATDYCVKHTVLDALRLGFPTVLLEDAVRAVEIEPGDGAEAIREMIAAGARVERVMAPAAGEEGAGGVDRRP
jgi:nicotinamidase/pyrazinamidase